MAWSDLSPFEKGAIVGMSPLWFLMGVVAGLLYLASSAVHFWQWSEDLWDRLRRPRRIKEAEP